MTIKTVQIKGGFSASGDCIVLKSGGMGSTIVMALPFHEDTPNLIMTISQAMDLRNALDALVKVPLIEHNREVI